MEQIIAELKLLNRSMTDLQLTLYAQTLKLYAEAKENLDKNGTICLHPRTGAPIENPYLKIHNQQLLTLKKFNHVKTNEKILKFFNL